MFNNNKAAASNATVAAEKEIKEQRMSKIMTKDQAIEVLEDIKNKICDVDLDDLCGDEVEIEKGENDRLYKRILQAIMCGLVYWDDEKDCMIQKLIKPIKSNEIIIEQLEYKYSLKLGQIKSINAKNEADVLLQSLTHITGRAKQALEKLSGRDNEIAAGCFNFFDR